MEIIDLTNSAPQTPKAHVESTKTSAQNTHLRPKPVIRKLSTAENARSRPQLVLKENVQWHHKIQNPNGQPHPQIQHKIMHEEGQGSGSQTSADSGKQFSIYYVRGNVIKDDWTEKENELFQRGVIKYGKRNWDKIAREFVSTKTPEQVSRYAAVFFKQIPTATCLYTYNFKKTETLPARFPWIDLNRRERTPPLESSSTSMAQRTSAMASHPSPYPNSLAPLNSNPVLKHEVPIPVPTKEPQRTLHLFPVVEAPLFPVSVEMSAKTTSHVEPHDQPVSLRALAEEPDTMGITLSLSTFTSLPNANSDDDGTSDEDYDDGEELNLDLTLGRRG